LVHVHNADESVLTPQPWKQAVLRPLLRQTCLRLADTIVGISNHTLDTFLVERQRRVGKDRVHYYAIDPAPFLAARSDRVKFRQELGLAEDALIILFAGRMVPEKNPLFAVDVFAEMRKRNPRVVAARVGSGSMEQAVISRANELGVGDSCRFLGWRSDVPEVMTCCDWFILPRPEQPMEGLGIAVVEAQLAGLRLLLSRGIADDPLLLCSVWARLGLSEGAEKWAEEALKLLEKVPPTPQMAAAKLARSSFDMDFALTDLRNLYS
jgi:glycosyltransferase involved in cell wall biosynthesis